MLPTTDTGKVDFFNLLNIVSTAVLVLATASALFASWMSIKYSKRVNNAQDQHVKAQDVQIKQLDKQIADAQLAAKVQDKQIADAREAAAVANKSARETTERTAKLEQRASEAEARAKRSEAEIAKANAAAHDADARAASSQAEIAKANAASRQAAAEVASAQVRIAEAQREAATANQVAEAERLARIQLEARLAPRTLSAEQQEQMSKLLASYSQTSADIYVFEDTSDCRTLSGILFDCLTQAGWIVHIGYVSNSPEVVHGVVIGADPVAGPRVDEAGNILVANLQSMGIAAGKLNYSKMTFSGAMFDASIGTPSQIRIFVGSKP